MTPQSAEAEMRDARLQLEQLGQRPDARKTYRSHALTRRLLALWAWKLNLEAQQARQEA